MNKFQLFMKYLNAINKIPGIGAKKIKLLLIFFEKPEKIWQANLQELKKSGIGEKTAENFYFEKEKINPELEWEIIKKENIQIIPFYSEDYPKILKEIPNPPFLLYKKGNLDLNLPAISIVGSRKYTKYGSLIARSLAKDLAKAGLTIISGMAIGIDAFSHRGALDTNGNTIAVLGSSLEDNAIYPRINFNLSKEIEKSGAIISECPPGTKIGPISFPARNRIIAGMSLGTIVIEASEKSGSLITAKMALDCNREVFSVPGSIFSSVSYGTNDLIKKGAKLVTCAKDVLEELNIETKEKFEKKIILKNPNKEEKIILDIISQDPLHIDNISKMAKLQPASCASILVMMEMKGWIKNIGGQNYINL